MKGFNKILKKKKPEIMSKKCPKIYKSKKYRIFDFTSQLLKFRTNFNKISRVDVKNNGATNDV